MAEQIDYNTLDETAFLVRLSATITRHVSNIENASLMMRNGQFIDAFDRIKSSKEGLQYMKKLLESRIAAKSVS